MSWFSHVAASLSVVNDTHMLDKLSQVEKRFSELEQSLSSPEIAGKPELLRKYSKEHKELSKIVGVFRERISAKPGEALPMAPDPKLVHLFDKETGLRLN